MALPHGLTISNLRAAIQRIKLARRFPGAVHSLPSLVRPLFAFMAVIAVGLSLSNRVYSQKEKPLDSSTVLSNLRFAPHAPDLTLDLYLPVPKANDSAVSPVIIVIQGGGFFPQDGKRFAHVAEYLCERGFAAALVSYRGRPDHRVDDTLQDLRCAVDFVRQHSAEYGLDAQRVGATGRSAGGTLAALLAVTGKQHNCPILAVVGFAGVYDFISRFTDPDQLALQPRHKAKIRTNAQWIGEPFAPEAQAWKDASPVAHVTRHCPPMLLLHSKDDSTVPWQQSSLMHRALEEAGVHSELIVYETGGHAVEPQNADSLEAMTTFFQKHL